MLEICAIVITINDDDNDNDDELHCCMHLPCLPCVYQLTKGNL